MPRISKAKALDNEQPTTLGDQDVFIENVKDGFESPSKSLGIKILDYLSYGFLISTVFLMPLLFDNKLANFYLLSKEYLLVFMVLASLTTLTIRSLLAKEIIWKRSVMDVPLFLWLLFALLSSLFSKAVHDSFLGRSDYFVLSFGLLVFLVAFYLLIIKNVDSWLKWDRIIKALILVGILSEVFFLVKVIFGLNFFNGISNTVDGLNGIFGNWSILIFVLAGGFLIYKGKKDWFFWLCLSASLLSFVVLLVLGFKMLWIQWLIALFLLLLVGITTTPRSRIFWLSIIFAAIILSIIFIIFGSPKFLQATIPVEVFLSFSSSWDIVLKTLTSGFKEFVLGSGLGTFMINFSNFRPETFNYSDVTLGLRFGQPFNSVLSLFSDGGIVSGLIFILILLLVIGHVFQGWMKNYKNKNSLPMDSNDSNVGDIKLLVVFVAWLWLSISLCLNFYGIVFWLVWFLLLALIVLGLDFLGFAGMIKEKRWQMYDIPQFNLAFSFVAVLSLAVWMFVLVFVGRFYFADRLYVSSLRDNDLKSAEVKLNKAISLNKYSDIYHLTLARLYLLQSAELARTKDSDINNVTRLVALAVNEAKVATDLSPNLIGTWENLTTMYENASVLAPGAQEWVFKSLNQAINLEPTNPVLHWRLGNNYNLNQKYKEAIESYKKAIDLKKNYVAAYIGLADVYEKNKQFDEAIESYRSVFSLIVNNPEALYNFGRLLYNRNQTDDRDNAEKLWLEVVRQQPNYSNALYSLGLLYENKGQKTKAEEYYEKVQELNPGNAVIDKKLDSFNNSVSQESVSTTISE